jgi:hypothetical protein
MSPLTLARRPCAAPCDRLELAPSRRAALAFRSWAVLATTALAGASLPPWPIRILGGLLLILTTGRAVVRFVSLRGPRSLQAIEWGAGPGFLVRLGDGRRLPAIAARGCRRYGIGLWVLRFDTISGPVAAVIDTRRQEPRSLRRLSRRLGWGPEGHSGRPPAAS